MKDSLLTSTYGQVLKELRAKKKISQEDLAFKSNLHPTYISLLERGLRQPSLTVIFEIAVGLDIDPKEFIEIVSNRLKRDQK